MNNPLELVHFVQWRRIAPADYGKTLAELKAGGVDAVVAHDMWGDPETDVYGTLRSFKRLADAAGVRVPAAHGLWRPKFDLGLCGEEGIAAHRRFLDALAELGVRTYTVHPGFTMSAVPEGFFARLRDNVGALMEPCRDAGIVLAVENGMESFAELERTVAVVAETRSPYCGMCCDVGHAHCYPHDLAGVMETMAPWIVTMHLHDNDGTHDDHAAPGAGTLDWALVGRKMPGLPRLLHAETEVGTAWDAAVYRSCRDALACPSVIARRRMTD